MKTLFIWPEGVFSGYNFSQIKILKEIFKKHFSKNHLILFGVNRFDPYQIGTYNSNNSKSSNGNFRRVQKTKTCSIR